MSKKPPNWKADVNAIRRILMDEWDPIDCGVPDDEYDSYIPVIYQLMHSGASAQEISARLTHIETVDMGLNKTEGGAERNDRVAKLLLDLLGQPE